MTDLRTERKHQRYTLSVPVDFRGESGVTRNISLGGIYFEAAASDVVPGSLIRFALLFDHDGGAPLRLECGGTVLRVDPRGGSCGIAATIDCFESILAALRPALSPSRDGRAPRDH